MITGQIPGHAGETDALQLDPYDYCIDQEIKLKHIHPMVMDEIMRHGFWHGDRDPGPARMLVA